MGTLRKLFRVTGIRYLPNAGAGCLVLGALLLPSVAWADGGGPILLIFGTPAFLLGQVAIILIEWPILKAVSFGRSGREALADTTMANLASLGAVGVAVPVAVSAVSLGVAFLLNGMGFSIASDYAAVLGGWVWEGEIPGRLWRWVAVAWVVISYPLTVLVERRVLARRWKTTRGTGRASLLSNAASYVLLAGLALWAALS